MDPYLPQEMFSPIASNGRLPRVFIAPARYVQGPDVLAETGRYLSLLDAGRAGVLISARGKDADGALLLDGLKAGEIEPLVSIFGGECSLDEIDGQVAYLRDLRIDCLVAVGGGKCVDAGKAIAWRLKVPVVIVPTLASNDAPCSALSVVYTPDGVFGGAEFFPDSPALVVVDTRVVADAPVRYLVAGMGDAMATWYEARVCLLNEAAVSAVGARPTLASSAIGRICAETLFDHGADAATSVAEHRVDDAVERVVEANTLLSGLGFESGGLAAAHAFAQSYTGIDVVRNNYLHGEMVAMGTLAQLVMESRPDEARRVAGFFAQVGLPVHLEQLSLTRNDSKAIETITEGALAFPFMGNMPGRVDARTVTRAILDAHELGLAVAGETGDAAWRRLQSL